MPAALVPAYKYQAASHFYSSSITPPLLSSRYFLRLRSAAATEKIGCRGMNSSPVTAPEEAISKKNEGGGGLTESTFLASLMPKKEIGADRFLEANPQFDGRGVLIAIFDSGVDPAAAGLHVTSDGKPKILDIIDCTGSGDVDTSKIVKADADGYITGASGARLAVNSAWKNPSQEWHVGCKQVYELFTNTLTNRIKEERKKKWSEKNQEAISEALEQLNEFDKKHTKTEDLKQKRMREDLQNRLEFLRKEAESYDDRGPIIDVVVWHDADVWRVAIDTQDFGDGSEHGKLADFEPLTNYRIERKYGIFSKLDACSFVTNVYDEGNLVSIVTDCSPHGTHVAGIASAYHQKEPLLNGVAPGAQLISCKIGDTRLGSMETGTGLVRALIAAVEHKCDLINMSYGEPTLLPDYGRFVDLVNEVVCKHRLIFISSAGNNGPALSTVGSPGGTSSSIIGIGAYVSPEMAAAAHCLVEPLSEGLEYTWSSRGPTIDGDLGVSVSAPGGAVAPVPTWTLQRRQLMNGTSMASPSACGGVALLLSGMKAMGIPVSPFTVRKALENTATPIGDKLSTGQGLMQVDRAFDYLLQSKSFPCVSYRIMINMAGKSTPTSRGIYLRGATACQQASEWTIQVSPVFHEGASNMKELVPFEECIQLCSSDNNVVCAPDYLLLTHNGRNFNVVVDPTKLSNGLHYHEVYGIDCKSPARGPLFRLPITIIKPICPEGQPSRLLFSNLSFQPGHIERRFIDVPNGATWVEASIRSSGFDTCRKFYVDAVQISPLKRPTKWEGVPTFSSPSLKNFMFPVQGGLALELAIAQFWSSGIGSHENTMVDFEIVFHGITTNQDGIVLDGSGAPVRIEASSPLGSEKLAPAATLDKLKTPYRPVDSKLTKLPTPRDKLPSGMQILALTLIYKFKLDEGGEVKPCFPLLNNRVYDNKIESQFYVISDSNKRVYAFGDVYPEYVKLPKGDYTLQLYIRHENILFLEKMKQLDLFIEQKLEKKSHIQLSFYTEPDGPITGSGAFESSSLVPGKLEAFYVGPPSKDKIVKNYQPGAQLVGSITYATVSKNGGQSSGKPPVSYQITYLITSSKVEDNRGKEDSSCSTKSVPEQLEEEVRNAKINFLSSLKKSTKEDKAAWKKLSASLKEEYPKCSLLLAKILEGLLSGGGDEDKVVLNEEVISAADDVIASIDKDDLAKYFSLRPDYEDEEGEETRKKMEITRDQLVEALYQKGLALADLESCKVDHPVDEPSNDKEGDLQDSSDKAGDCSDLFEDNFKELKKWVDMCSPKYSLLSVIRERRSGRLGNALKLLADLIHDESHPPRKNLYDLKIELIDEIGWTHISTYERQWLHIRFPHDLPPL